MLRNKNIWILMSGEMIAGLGMWIGIIGNLEFLQSQVPSDFMKSLILFSGLFVGVLFGPIAGRVIDQYAKKKIMLYAGGVRILSVGFMFLAIAQESVMWMIIYMIGIGLSAAFYFPALQAAIPLIAREGQLLSLNGIHMNVGTIARISGTALAGILLVYISLLAMYLYTFICYIMIFLCTLALNIEEPQKNERKEVKKNVGFKDVWPIISGTPAIFTGLLLMLVPITFIGSFNMMVLKISEMQNDPAIKGLLYTTEGISLMIGAFLIKRISAGKNVILILMTSAFFIAIAHLTLFFADQMLPALLSFALFGFAAGSFFPLAATLFQTQVSKEFHGRFFSFRNMMDRVLFQVVLLSTGLFLDTIGFEHMVLSFGGFSLFIVIIMAIRQVKSPVTYIQERSK
ncbi:MFS transporter [Bacillus sp. FJAT-29790]|uniref:MFS transporter n=1 Tax=Bacillus sp. FJAT-29790 TaxID=1895002 RepID=UPI001C2232F0|nr:MFS transporter [Bacillus sp. FJAT-29790]MBU8877614.1 MFS transporter [Bacillus sp. FJAT-29790]